MRTYDYYVLLHEDGEFQHSQHDDQSKVKLRHRSGPLEALEEVTHRKTEVEDEG